MLSLDTLQDALTLASVPMLVADKGGRIVLVNAEFETLFGYSTGELVEQSIDCLIPEPLRAHHGEYLRAYMRVPAKRAMGQGRTLKAVTKSGQELPLELALNSLNIDGQDYSLVAAVDVRIRLDHQRMMELAMEAAATPMLMVDANGKIILINGAALKLSGYQRDEVLAHNVELLIKKEDRVAHRVFRANFNVSKDKVRMGNARLVHLCGKDGELVPVEIALTSVTTPEGEMTMCTMTDLTERIAAETAMRAKNQELRDTNWQLADANKDLTQFAYAVSHDLKAPLSSLQGLMQLIKEDLKAGRADEVVENIERALGICQRSRVKVERVLKMAGDSEMEAPTEICLTDLVSGTWEAIAPGATTKAEFNQNLGVDTILTRPASLEVVMHNLLSNAVRFNDPEKDSVKIAVTAQETDETIEISVVDNGIGIAEAYQKEVFKMFRRLDGRSGDGIGLALVQKNVGRLGGKITLKSEVGLGSSFRLSLPRNGVHLPWKLQS